MNVNRKCDEKRSAFTLTEMVVVSLVIAILSSVTVAKFFDRKTEAEVAATRRSLQTIQRVIDEYVVENGSFPNRVRSTWFAGDQLPRHPMNDIGLSPVHVFKSDDRLHPKNKALSSGRQGAFWYNPKTGLIRARVREDYSDADKLKYYNRINGCELSSLSDID